MKGGMGLSPTAVIMVLPGTIYDSTDNDRDNLSSSVRRRRTLSYVLLWLRSRLSRRTRVQRCRVASVRSFYKTKRYINYAPLFEKIMLRFNLLFTQYGYHSQDYSSWVLSVVQFSPSVSGRTPPKIAKNKFWRRLDDLSAHTRVRYPQNSNPPKNPLFTKRPESRMGISRVEGHITPYRIFWRILVTEIKRC